MAASNFGRVLAGAWALIGTVAPANDAATNTWQEGGADLNAHQRLRMGRDLVTGAIAPSIQTAVRRRLCILS
jgi:hypothetical protein